MQAKQIAYRHLDGMVITPRTEKDLKNMKLCLRLKVNQYPYMKDLLLKTLGQAIFEDCSKRPQGMFWGAKEEEGGWVGGWVGPNHLGELWMELRESLSQEKEASVLGLFTY